MRTAKAVVAAFGVVVTALSEVLADEVFEWSEVGTVATVLVAAVISVWGVWRVPNQEN